MTDIPSKRADRDAVLVGLHLLTQGDPNSVVRHEELAAETSLDVQRVTTAVDFLVGRSLARFVTMGPTIGITPDGVDRAEELLAPTIMETSQVLAALTVAEHREVEVLLSRATEALERASDLDAETHAAVQADLEAVQAQLRSLVRLAWSSGRSSGTP